MLPIITQALMILAGTLNKISMILDNCFLLIQPTKWYTALIKALDLHVVAMGMLTQ